MKLTLLSALFAVSRLAMASAADSTAESTTLATSTITSGSYLETGSGAIDEIADEIDDKADDPTGFDIVAEDGRILAVFPIYNNETYSVLSEVLKSAYVEAMHEANAEDDDTSIEGLEKRGEDVRFGWKKLI